MAAPQLTALDDHLLARVLAFLGAKEVEAAAVASRVVAREVLPRFPSVWQALFRHRWEALNFPLAGDARLSIDRRLRARFPADYSESRVLQLLTHAVTPLPAYADLQRTSRASGFDAATHGLESLHGPDTRVSHVVSFGFNGNALGDDRCARANAPFPATFHVGVFKRRQSQHGRETLVYEVGLVASGYFELSVSARDVPRRPRLAADPADAEGNGEEAEVPLPEELASIGLVADSFPLVGRQPGWNLQSYGYHSDNGHVYRQSTQGQYFGPRFGVNDTVGCGVRRDQRQGRSSVFFSHNGVRVAHEGGDMECQHASLYPAVGIDSYQQVTVNFGQREFAHDAVVDEMFAECDDAFDALAARKPEDVLPWFDIADGYAAWRRLRQSKPHSLGMLEGYVSEVDGEELDEDYDEYGEEVEKKQTNQQEGADECTQTVVNKWIGLLTRRQQNRLDSRNGAVGTAAA